MFEHSLSKIRILNFEIQSLGRAQRKGVGGKEFLPALAFRLQFFSAAAFYLFRIHLFSGRRISQSAEATSYDFSESTNGGERGIRTPGTDINRTTV